MRIFFLTVLIVFNIYLAFGQRINTSIDKINSLCSRYDDYKRVFSFDESSGVIKWVSGSGIICDVELSKVKFGAKDNTSFHSVYFECKDGSKCINCTYGGPTTLSSVSINDKYAAQDIVAEIETISSIYNNKSGKLNLSTGISGGSYQASIDKINKMCNTYDPYKRFFSYNPSTKVLKWVTGDGDITCDAVLGTVIIENERNSSYVTFKCKDASKCINCTYGGPTNVTSITVNDNNARDQIVREIENIASGAGNSGLLSSNTSNSGSQKKIDRVNELCKTHDPYKRFFTYNSGVLKWVTGDGDITCDASPGAVNITADHSSSYVTFKCKDGSKCINCTYGGPTSISSITVKDYSAREEICKELGSLSSAGSSTLSNSTYSNISSGSYKNSNSPKEGGVEAKGRY